MNTTTKKSKPDSKAKVPEQETKPYDKELEPLEEEEAPTDEPFTEVAFRDKRAQHTASVIDLTSTQPSLESLEVMQVEPEEVSEVQYPVEIEYMYVALVSLLTSRNVRGWFKGERNNAKYPLKFTQQGFEFKPPREAEQTVLYTDIVGNPKVPTLRP